MALVNTSTAPTPDIDLDLETPLKDARWAMAALGYRPEQRTAFWLFVNTHNVPRVVLGPRRILFDEVELRAWVAARRTGSKPRA